MIDFSSFNRPNISKKLKFHTFHTFYSLGLYQSIKFLFAFYKTKYFGDCDFYYSFKYRNNDILLHSNIGDLVTFIEIMFADEYKKILNFSKYNENEKIDFIDAGANIGLAYVYFREKLKIDNYIGIEPLPSNQKALRFNTFGPKSVILEKALWTDSSPVKFSTNFTNNANAISGDGEITVNTVTLFEVLEMINTPNRKFLKIDIEGSEYNLLEQNINLVNKKIKYLAIEFHDTLNRDFNEIYIKMILPNFDYMLIEKSNGIKLLFSQNISL